LGSGRCGFRDWVQVGGRGAGSRGGVEDEVAEQFARGGGVDDADVAVGDEHDDAGLGVFAAEADVVEAAVVAEGDASGLVDLVVADAPVGVVGAAAGMGWVRAAVLLGGAEAAEFGFEGVAAAAAAGQAGGEDHAVVGQG
jgi:hypothetical protein